MFPNEAGTEYTVWFRPTKNIDRNSPHRFDCRYFRFSDHEVEALNETNTLNPGQICLGRYFRLRRHPILNVR